MFTKVTGVFLFIPPLFSSLFRCSSSIASTLPRCLIVWSIGVVTGGRERVVCVCVSARARAREKGKRNRNARARANLFIRLRRYWFHILRKLVNRFGHGCPIVSESSDTTFAKTADSLHEETERAVGIYCIIERFFSLYVAGDNASNAKCKQYF